MFLEQTQMRILVADDNAKAVGVLADFLTFIGHDVQVAYDGRDALAVANSFHPTAAFLDIEMPLMSGYEVARQIRSDPTNTKVVLTAVTGLPSENEGRALGAGFDHFLAKPVDLADIEALLKKHAADASD